jgi:membrane complex biogenesis BtpA family protein
MEWMKEIFGTSKPIIGMVHFPPLPGAPLYDDSKGMSYILERVRKDLLALQNGGVDAVMFCNENDRPYTLKADFSTVAAMSRVIGELISEIEVPFGVDVLWDPFAALAIAKATGAKFIREVITGAYVSDMGIWNTSVGELYRYRKAIDACDIKVFFNISAEFASRLDSRNLEDIARSVEFSSLADVILVSGPMTGEAPNVDHIKKVKEKVSVPVFANTGVKHENVEEVLKVADGAIVGTSFKVDGITWNPVDEGRVKRFMEIVRRVRG